MFWLGKPCKHNIDIINRAGSVGEFGKYSKKLDTEIMSALFVLVNLLCVSYPISINCL